MKFPTYRNKQKLIDNALMDYFPEKPYPHLLYDAMKYSVGNGGKRLRSVICMSSYEIFKKDIENVLPTAIAIEFIHTYSLIHDDLPVIDNDDLRRGKPTCHKKYGENMAILAGDALYSEAISVIANKQKGSSEQINEVIRELVDATGPKGMVAGQTMDVLSEEKDIDEETINYIHRNKKGKLIKDSAVVGAILANADKNSIDIIKEYSDNLGMAFQITDDILDETKTTVELGKPAKSDAKLKKATYPSLFGLEKAKEQAQKHKNAAIDIIRDLNNNEELIKLSDYIIERSY